MAPPNIVRIPLDSVRTDHTSVDGYERDTTPTLQRRGDAGHAFTECIAHSLSTLPSSGAILNGSALVTPLGGQTQATARQLDQFTSAVQTQHQGPGCTR